MTEPTSDDTHPYDRGGVQGVVQDLYNTVRRHLPRKLGLYNGIPARGPRLFDATDVLPDYERNLLGLVRAAVDEGDAVTLVGGGLGISTIVAAKEGAASVTVYEAAEDRARLVAENADLHDLDGVRVRHAAVGDPRAVTGEMGAAGRLSPTDLPGGDVLVLDCEGAEADIINQMPAGYGAVVVETHGVYGTTKADVLRALETRGATVEAVRDDNPAAGIYNIYAEL